MNDHEIFLKEQQKRLPNIDTSHRCPLRCPQCTRAKLQSPKTSGAYKETKSRIINGFDLPFTDAKKMLDFFDEGLMLCGSISDPAYWPNLFELLHYSWEWPEKKIQIHTAATQKDLNWYQQAFELSHRNTVWIFGLDGMADTSPIYRIGQDSELLFYAMLLAKEMHVTAHWHYIVFEHNVHQIDQARDFASRNGIELSFVKTDRTGGNMTVPKEWQPARNKEIT